MSCTTLYRLYETRVTPAAEYRNGWGSAPALWQSLCKKYLPGYDWFIEGRKDNLQKLLGLAKDPRASESERAALFFTMDGAVIRQPDAARIADLLEKVHQEILDAKEFTWNHWAAIGTSLRESAKHHDSECLGFVLSCTSVNDPWEGGPESWRKQFSVGDELKDPTNAP